MGRKRKKKPQYNLSTTLQPRAINSTVEDLARSLYELACCGSRCLLEEIKTSGDINENPEIRSRFFEAAHQGMWKAQNMIVERVRSDEDLTLSLEVLFRGIADSIAWQLIGQQLCYARRFFKGHNQPDLRHSNFNTVVMAAECFISDHPSGMALISDLTSFIQVGDLLTLDPDSGLCIVEVKEGRKNKTIAEFMKFYLQHNCDRSLLCFADQEGKQSVKQLERMLRQLERMSHVTEIMDRGKSIDPDTKSKIRIPDDYVFIDTWDDELKSTLMESESKGWAISVIDECLFLGCYSGEPMNIAGHVLFNGWFDSCGGTSTCPRSLLIDSMNHPLAKPLFNIDIPDEYKFDVLFGRKQVCIGINVESFLEQCKKAGLQIRFATNKEASMMNQMGIHPYRHKGKVVYLGNGKIEMALMDGIFLRAIFHGQRPINLIKTYLENSEVESL